MRPLGSDPSEAVVAWERYAQGRQPRRRVNARGARTWLNWTQYPDHGPDESVLGEVSGRAVLELGCGTGCNLAHLATLGASCVGVDIAPSQRAKAEARWGHLPGLGFHTADAVDFLTAHDHDPDRDCAFDAVFSIFGAVWFTDPARLLPLVMQRLAAGGVFAFSHLPTDAGGRGSGRAIGRWDYTAERWQRRLVEVGFVDVTARVVPPPENEETGTLLVRALRARR